MRVRLVLLASLLVAACANVPEPLSSDQLLNDSLFAASSQRISGNDVFAVSPEMKRYLATDIAADVKIKGPQQGLFDALYSKNQLQLEYESTITRNAAQAFTARAGNCLSLVIMTGAFAKEMGLTVKYQQGYVDETWSRAGDLYLSIGHINLTLGMRHSEIGSPYYEGDKLTIDFLPPADIRGMHSRVVREETIIAMYMNNRAVESMAVGQLDDAYWWAREAIVQDPRFKSSYNTLGAIYEKHGNLGQAEQVLTYALAWEPKNTHVMSNLVAVLKALGRNLEATELARKLAQLEPDPPFGFFDRGIVAMRASEYVLARDLFAKEVDRAPYYHEFHFWLAAAYVGLGEFDLARKHMSIAMENSPTRGDRELYAVKLEKINAHRTR
jgi:Tfp pilus assembly protein PilF